MWIMEKMHRGNLSKMSCRMCCVWFFQYVVWHLVYRPWLCVQVQWAWVHQLCSHFVHRPCQISSVQHSQLLLNWVKDSEISFYWVYGSAVRPNIVRQANKWRTRTFFRCPGVKDAQGMTNFSSEIVWEFFFKLSLREAMWKKLTLWENLQLLGLGRCGASTAGGFGVHQPDFH